METAVQFPVTFSFEDILTLVRQLPRQQQQKLIELMSQEATQQRWRELSTRLPDADLSADEIQEEINAHRRETHAG